MKNLYRHITAWLLLVFAVATAVAQDNDKILNRQYADRKQLHFGFSFGANFQGLSITNNGRVTDDGEQYDLVILDPPAFTKNKTAVQSAIRGYKEINLRGLKLVRPGGFLVTCSCSQHVLPEMFQDVINQAARDAKKRIRLVEYRTQGYDHPILPQSVETKYLKTMILQVME